MGRGLASSRAQRKGFDRVLLYNRLNKKPGSRDHLLNFWLYLWVQDEFGHGCRNVQVRAAPARKRSALSYLSPDSTSFKGPSSSRGDPDARRTRRGVCAISCSERT